MNHMTKCFCSTLLLFATARLSAQVFLTSSSYAQNFDSLEAAGGANTTVPAGWTFLESGGNADGTYRAGTGSSSTGDTYSFGINDSSDRAFGTLQSGSLSSAIGAEFLNSSGQTISDLRISYTGEQWRLGTAGRADRLDFQYSLDATTLADGTWTDFDALDFFSPNTTVTGALDGNAAENRSFLNATLPGLNISEGSTFWFRWNDFNASGSDDGLGIDEFQMTAVPEPSTYAFVAGFLLLGFAAFRRRWRS